MQRLFTKNATGVAPDGRWYAGDVNALQDAVAAEYDLSQNIGVASLALGESALQLIRYGAGEARLSGALRVDGILRGLGGLFAGTFTTTQRDAISSGSAPYGVIILNSTTNRLEMNFGTDTARVWKPVGSIDPADFLSVLGKANLAADIAYLKGNSGRVDFGTTAGVTTAIIAAVQGGNDYEFGHSNPAGYRGTLGAEVTSGANFIAFHAEAGTTANTYRTRGVKGSVIKSDTSGGFIFGKADLVSSDNQSLTALATVSPGGVIAAGNNMTAGGFPVVLEGSSSLKTKINHGGGTCPSNGSASFTFASAFASYAQVPGLALGATAGGGQVVNAASVSLTGLTINSAADSNVTSNVSYLAIGDSA
jgi:hypothetical protein